MPKASSETPKMVAAVDLGSNSFHMVVARLDNDQLVLVDRLRESVRLGEGLNNDKSLKPEVGERALACLERFGQRLRGLPAQAVRAVGTNTMRQIDDDGEFLSAANAALGHPIEIIAGHEEARLVYLGVAHGLAAGDDRRLVIDIGGGSTELILGEGMSPGQRDSLYMGCVSMSRLMFSDGRITEDTMQSALLRAALEIRPVKQGYRHQHWDKAVGSSGTIRAIKKVVLANGWSDEGISAKSLRKLRGKLVEAGHIDKLKLEGLSDERRPVFAGGVAVLSALFEALDIDHMKVSDLALREGLLYELVGFIQHHDVRDRTVDSLSRRFGVDGKQAQRVEMTANALLSQVARNWGLADPEYVQLLSWAAKLHEIGLALAHGGFHKHGAYLLENADMPGFSRQQQARLAVLVRNHRRKIQSAAYKQLAGNCTECMRRLTLLLRLAVLIHRGRSASEKPMLYLDVDEHKIKVSFPDNWLAQHPLTQAELEREAEFFAQAGYKLKF